MRQSFTWATPEPSMNLYCWLGVPRLTPIHASVGSVAAALKYPSTMSCSVVQEQAACGIAE
jgi:hypothetical protein